MSFRIRVLAPGLSNRTIAWRIKALVSQFDDARVVRSIPGLGSTDVYRLSEKRINKI